MEAVLAVDIVAGWAAAKAEVAEASAGLACHIGRIAAEVPEVDKAVVAETYAENPGAYYQVAAHNLLVYHTGPIEEAYSAAEAVPVAQNRAYFADMAVAAEALAQNRAVDVQPG